MSYQIFYQYCPVCGVAYKKEAIKDTYTNKKYICSNHNCRYVLYLNSKPTVGAIILKNRKLLLVKRNWHPFKGLWQLPGGFMEYGERPEEALRREIREELNMDIERMLLYSVGEDKYQNYLDEQRFEEYSFLPITFLVKLKPGKIKISDDVAEFRYFDLNQIQFDRIAFVDQKKLIKKLLIDLSSKGLISLWQRL